MYMDETIPADQLPIRYIGYATSFRKEAGTYGKDMEGILRMHQFDKLEMEVFSSAETGFSEHQFLIAIQEEFLNELGLHYQKLNKCTADIGTPNASGVDLETWFPAQDKFRETSSADYMTDYQTRRLQTRTKINDQMQYVHTNDATCIVLSRIPPAIIENYQTENGDVKIPAVLKPFLGGREVL
jgi:seryl-tRNA synthetase